MSSCQQWARGPIAPDADCLYPSVGSRKVLVVVHTVTTGTRLLSDVAPLLESDFRIQVCFTRAPDPFDKGVDEFLDSQGGFALPWEQAVQNRFDLAIAAEYDSLHELQAPLVVVPHGGDKNKYAPQRPGQLRTRRDVFGLGPQWLLRDGAVVPSAVVLSHEKHRRILAERCPEALPAAVVAGDPCLDRMVASQHRRDAYRRALGVRSEQRLVVVTSTWGERGLLSANRELFRRLIVELPSEQFQIAMVLHPLIWYWNGPWMVRAWLAQCARAGITLLPPEEGWRAALIAADWVIGDYGSVTVYGAAMGAPVTFASFREDDVHPDSAGALLGKHVGRLREDRTLADQFATAAAGHPPDLTARILAELTSAPNEAGTIMRETFYRLMNLLPPDTPPVIDPLPLPRADRTRRWR